MNIRRISFFAAFMPIFMLVGCATLQPSGSERSSVSAPKWANYEEFARDTKLIVLYQTTLDELKNIGFHPNLVPNTKIIKDVRIHLLPRQNDVVDLLPPGGKACYLNFTECPGFSFNVKKIDIQGVGSTWLRVIKIQKEDITTGWKGEFEVFVLPRKYLDANAIGASGEELVVAFMKLGGMPNIQEVVVKKTPLGPLDIAIGAGRKMAPVSPPEMETD